MVRNVPWLKNFVNARWSERRNLLQRIIRSDSPKLERPLHAMVGYALQRTGFSSRLQLFRSRYTVSFFPKSNMALTYGVKSDVIDRAEEFAGEYLQPGATMVDVGANIGCVSAASSLAVGDSGRVCAIKAHPQTFRNLQETIRVNGFTNVTALNVALRSRSGTVCFTDEKRKDHNHRVSLTGATGIEVSCVTLSSLLKEQGLSHVHLMKLDVEGFEMEVLRGAVDVLSAVDCLYVEILDHTLRRFGSSAEELKSFLRSHGFQCFQFHGDSSDAVCFSPRVSPECWKSQLVPLV